MKQDAIIAVIVATLCMLLYILIRFKNINFASSAVLALLHDVLVVLMVYAVLKISVGGTFIACMLTIVGYSINATIIIFDRMRENLAVKRNNESFEEIVNKSISQTVSRCINTSITTLVMVFALFLFGVDSIKEFAGPLMAGLICGAYSSIFITGVLWFTLKNKVTKKA
jgi:SecD/SecF fusion protein